MCVLSITRAKLSNQVELWLQGMNKPMESTNGNPKQEIIEILSDVEIIKEETLTHVNQKETLELVHERSRTQNKLKELLRFPTSQNCSKPSCQQTINSSSNLVLGRNNSQPSTSTCSVKNACRSLCEDCEELKPYETFHNTKYINNIESFHKTNHLSVNVESLLSSFFSVSSSSLLDKDSTSNVNRSHPIITHILTGEDKNLGTEQVRISPERNRVYNPRNGVKCAAQLPASPLDTDSDNDVECFIDDAICKNLMSEKLEVSSDWEIGSRNLESPTNTTKYGNNFKHGRPSSLIISDITAANDVRQIISETLEATVKLVSSAEALDTCDKEAFNFIWIHIPASKEELLSLPSTIRHTKQNKNAVLIALTDDSKDEKRLYNFNDYCLMPLSKETIKRKYYQWVTNKDISDSDMSVDTPESVRTPESGISLDSYRNSEKSQSSQCESEPGVIDFTNVSLVTLKDSGSGLKKSSLVDMVNTYHTRSPVNSVSPGWCRAEHANKEKQRSEVNKIPVSTAKKRWERIKDSCDQLRVLLPYVRGRKTDMASILEMTVDYLRIITAALPQEFQSQIISIMSHGSPLLEPPNETSSKKTKNPIQSFSPPVKGSLSTEKSSKHAVGMSYCDPKSKIKMMTKSLKKSLLSSPIDKSPSTSSEMQTDNQSKIYSSFKKTLSTNISDVNIGAQSVKRENQSMMSEGSYAKKPNLKKLPKTICLPSPRFAILKDTKKENFQDDLASQMPNSSTFQLHSKTSEVEFVSNHVFSANQLNNTDAFQLHTQVQKNCPPSKIGFSERDLTQYGSMFYDGNLYTYFPNISDTTGTGFCIPGLSSDYVNPNAVLPFPSYNFRDSSLGMAHSIDHVTSNESESFRVNPTSDILNSSSIKNNHF